MHKTSLKRENVRTEIFVAKVPTLSQAIVHRASRKKRMPGKHWYSLSLALDLQKCFLDKICWHDRSPWFRKWDESKLTFSRNGSVLMMTSAVRAKSPSVLYCNNYSSSSASSTYVDCPLRRPHWVHRFSFVVVLMLNVPWSKGIPQR